MENGKHFSCRVIATGQTDAPIDTLELSSDGLYLAAGLEDGGACCWGLPTPIQPDIDDDPVSLAMKGKGKGRKLMKAIDEEKGRESGTIVTEEDDDDDDEDAPKQSVEEEALIVDLGLPLFRIEPPADPDAAVSASIVTEEASQVSSSSKKSKKGAPPPLPDKPVEDTSPAALAKKKSRYLPKFVFLSGPTNHRKTLSSAGQSGKSGLAATVIIWRTLSNVWKQYKLPSYSALEPVKATEDEADAAVPAKGKAAKGKGGKAPEVVEAKPRSKLVESDLKLIGRWIMSGNITTVTKSEAGGMTNLGFGCADGAVVLWDCKTNTPIAGCSRHQAAVTSLCFVSGSRYLVSGDFEGAIHFHDLDTSATISAHKARERHTSSHSTLGSRRR